MLAKSIYENLRVVPRAIKGFIPPNCQKLDLITDAEYVPNLVNVNTWL